MSAGIGLLLFILLRFVLLGLLLLGRRRRPLVVVPDVLVLVRPALGAVGAQALEVERLAAGALRIIDQLAIVAVPRNGLQVVAFSRPLLDRGGLGDQFEQILWRALLVGLELVDRFHGIRDRLLRLGLLHFLPLVMVPTVGV